MGSALIPFFANKEAYMEKRKIEVIGRKVSFAKAEEDDLILGRKSMAGKAN